jgi:hypothetical protein
MAVVATIALLQAARVMRSGAGFDGDRRVVLALCGIAVLAAVAGWALGSCWMLGRPGAGIGLGALSGVVPFWAGALAVAVINAVAPLGVTAGFGWLNWCAAAVLAVALVVVAVRPPARLAWWPVVLVVAWFVGPALTAAGYMEVYLRSGGGVPRVLPEALAATWQVFGQASLPENRYLLPWGVAVVGAAVIALLLARRRKVLDR